MKSLVLVLFFFFCSIAVINAQSRMNVGVRAVVGLPIGSFGDVAGTGFGAQGTYEIAFGNNLVGVGQVGYIKWSGKDVGEYSYGYSAVPLIFGAKYYITPGKGFYATSAVGFHFFSVSSDIPTVSFGGITVGGGSASASTTDFTFSIGAGYEVPLNKKVSLDIGGAYNLISDANYFTIHAGGKLGL
jgi:opacity protein-like surface antigen